jgi:signal transduction histidine kinase
MLAARRRRRQRQTAAPRALRALQAALDRERAASAAKTRFFAAASHDLRQPLQALAINASTLALLARQQGDARISRLAADIDLALHHTNQLLDGLLDLSQLDAGALRPACIDLDLPAWLDGVVAEFAPLAAQRGLGLARLPSLPAGPQPGDARPGAGAALRAHTDPGLLRRVLHNLVANALKFTDQGAVTLQAGVAADGRITVAVVDSGVGIPLHEQARVFDEFHQVPGPAAGGLGLGLAIVRRLCGLLGLGLQLTSQPGQGTQVLLSLPPARGAGSGGLTSAAAAA